MKPYRKFRMTWYPLHGTRTPFWATTLGAPPFPRWVVSVLAVFLSAVSPALAVPPLPTIQVAESDLVRDELVIFGAGFGTSPAVTLSGVALTVLSATDTEIVAALPPSLTPATYKLIVSQKSLVSPPFEVTIGAVGPTGPSGATGPTGA